MDSATVVANQFDFDEEETKGTAITGAPMTTYRYVRYGQSYDMSTGKDGAVHVAQYNEHGRLVHSTCFGVGVPVAALAAYVAVLLGKA